MLQRLLYVMIDYISILLYYYVNVSVAIKALRSTLIYLSISSFIRANSDIRGRNLKKDHRKKEDITKRRFSLPWHGFERDALVTCNAGFTPQIDRVATIS